MAESNKIFDLITPFINQVQNIEDMLDDLRKLRWIINATGLQLDNIGTIVDLSRQGMSDTDYRTAIYRKIQFNISSGQPETLIEYMELITEEAVDYTEPSPATARIDIFSLPDPISVLREIRGLKPVGVKIDFKYSEDKTLAFNFADENGHVSDGYGFLEDGYPETNGYTAGKISELITIY